MKYLITFLLLCIPVSVLAEDSEGGEGESVAALAEDNWEGEGELGFNKSTGNTETEALLARLKTVYSVARWTHTGVVEAVNTSDSGARTAESYAGKLSSDFAITDEYYAFGKSRYEETRFSGYDYQASLATGFGVHFLDDEITTLNLALGAGYRRSKEQDTGNTLEEAILQLSGTFYHQLTDTTRFESDLSVESGDKNVYSEATLAVKVKINSHLALKLGYQVKNNSDVPPDTDNTDTLTSVSLSYSF